MDLRTTILGIAKERIGNDDPSHDFSHACRVLNNAEYIAQREGGDSEIIIPAALLHDVVIYPKNDARSKRAAAESADLVAELLGALRQYPRAKIAIVKDAIISHSYSAGIKPLSLEGQIVQDADRLEATGAIAIMRTFASTGQMRRAFYNPDAPFAPSEGSSYALDLFYQRLLHVESSMNTATAQRLARDRTAFLHTFLSQLASELSP